MSYVFFRRIEPDEKIEDIKKELDIEDDIIEKNILFPTEEDAKNYLEDMSALYSTLYTKFQEPLENFIDSKEAVDIKTKLLTNIELYFFYPDKLIERLENQKSTTKSCTNCKSIINKEFYNKKVIEKLDNFNNENKIENIDFDYIKLTKEKKNIMNCPICNSKDFIFNETDNEKHNKILANIQNSFSKFEEEELLFKAKSGNKVIGMIFYKKH